MSTVVDAVDLFRRMLFDDSFGVGEPLNETAFGTGLVIRGKHRNRAREIV